MIHVWREKAQKRFLEIGEPKPKQERFQYLALAHLKLAAKASSENSVTLESIEAYRLPEFAHCLVFVDGYFSPALSSLPKDLVCLPLDQAFQSYGLFLQNRWTKALKEEKDWFSAVNAAEHGRGAFMYAPPNVKAELHILNILTSDALGSPRLEMTLGKQADVTLVQTHVHLQANACCNQGIDLTLGEGSKVRLLDMALMNHSTRSFWSVRATLKRDARLEVLAFTDGAAVMRSSFSVELAEENSSLSLQGLAMLADSRQAHVHALVDHAAPNCTSRQHFKAALAGTSQSSFEGKIFVRPIAQKTMAYQLNNNLVLSDEARSNSKPNLEIFADDVKASHGSTVTQLSTEELFYLRSRGLSEGEAKSLLANGFCKELIDAVEIHSLRAPLFAAMKHVLASSHAL
ncbi:MAG TPA: Fe-S cluster assembly protein SufD [Chlamydiales bacterium]|jgi:Fe-S cluster assembly protein SufD|nr:Fe-S cluster assembly protein SufD [Chlamydiales bacterium]